VDDVTVEEAPRPPSRDHACCCHDNSVWTRDCTCWQIAEWVPLLLWRRRQHLRPLYVYDVERL